MDDYLYILIGIIWLAVSIYQSQRKMKQKQQKAAQRRMENTEDLQDGEEEYMPKRRSFIDEIFEELNKEGGEYPYGETVSSPPPSTPSPYKTDERPSDGNRYGAYSVESYRSAADMTEPGSELSKEYFRKTRDFIITGYVSIPQTELNPMRLIDDEDDENEGFEFDFDLRSAVIYSEILNRPYT